MTMSIRWRSVFAILGILLSAVSGYAAPAPGGAIDFTSLSPAEAVPGELLVKFRSDVSVQTRTSMHVAANAAVKHSFESIPWQLVEIADRATLQTVADAYLAEPSVVTVEPNYIIHAIDTIPDDPDYDRLWGMERIHAPAAWDTAIGTPDVVVAVIDTGIRRSHEDLADNMWTNPDEIPDNGRDDDGNGYVDDVHGWDFVNNDNDPTDDHGHGTHCAGTIGGVGNNGIGVVGVNWNVSMVGVKFLSADGSGTTDGAIKSVEYVSSLADHIRISNNSWGGGGYSTALEEAIRESGANNQLFIAAAGNSSTDNDANPHYPSSYDLSNIVAVASITSGGAMSSFSCYGATSVDIGAPGSDILSTVSSSDSAYDTYSGTSMATPHVCGAAALLWGQNLLAAWEDIRDVILDTAAPNPALTGRVVTDGELDVAAAMGQVGGALTLDRLAYRSDAQVGITVADANVLDPTNTVEVAWQTTDSNAVLRAVGALDLVRVPGSGFFTNTLQLVPGPTNMAVHGDRIRVSYVTSGTNSVVVTAPIDDVPPVISNVRAVSSSQTSELIAWDTDESASALALVSLTVPPDTNAWQGTTGFADWGSDWDLFPHSVTFDALDEQSIYHYAVRSADPAGNASFYPVDLLSSNSTDYPRFATSYARAAFAEDFESGELAWTHGGLNDGWAYGAPVYGPDAAHSGSNCWATSLDSDYPDLLNAWLVSPPVSVGTSPRLTFMSWHLIEEGCDNGYVEVNWGSGWATLLAISGSSLGEWVPVTVVLPEAANNRVIQVRFRLQSDYLVNYAGWYIDDVVIQETAGLGIGIIDWVNPVNDAAALDADNDEDGYPETGETFDLNFRIFNSRDMTFTGVVSRVDCPANGVTIDANHDELDFGDVPFGTLVQGAQGVRVVVSDSPPMPLDNVPFLHTITAAGGYEWRDVVYLDLTAHEFVSGLVTNMSGDPVAGATVHGMSAAAEVEATTAADGTYTLNGLGSGVGYNVYAAKPGAYGASPSVTVTGPAVNVNFTLGRAYAEATPASLSFVVAQTGTDDALLTIANTNALADQTLVVALTGTVDLAGMAVRFPGTPDPLTVAPGGSDTVTVHVAASGVDTGDYKRAVLLVGNAVQGTEVEIPIDIEVQPGPALDLGQTFVDDTLLGDGDGFIDPGETVEPAFVVWNNGDADANAVTGRLTFVGTTGVTAVTDGDLDFGTIMSGFFWFDLGRIDVDPAAPDELELPFTLELWNAASNYWLFPVSFTVQQSSSITGTVTDAVTSLPREGVTVTAVGGAMGRQSDISDVDGTYGIHGMPDGVYTVSVAAVAGYANPPSQVCVISNADCTADFALPPLDITWDPASFALSVSEGRTLDDSLTISNSGSPAVEVRLRGAMKEGALIDPSYPVPDVSTVDWDALTDEDAYLDRVIVRFREGVAMSAIRNTAASVNGKVIKRLRNIPAALISLPPTQPLNAAASVLTADASVQYVQPDYKYKLDALSGTPRREPNDTFYAFGQLWGLDNEGQNGGTQDADIDGPESWFLTTGDTNVIVAVLDTGIDWEHDDLMANLWRNPGEDGIDTNGMHMSINGVDDDANGYVDDYHGWNFLYSTNGGFYDGYYTNGWPIDDHGHGTHVSGTIGAVGNNNGGVAGVNWQVRIMALKIGSGSGIIDAFAAAEALEYAVDNGAKVSNNSWGGLQFNHLFYEMVAHARTNGQLVVCAAGNSGVDNDAIPHYPSSDPSDNILSVAAADRDDLLAGFSNWGENAVDIAAPGVAIVSTYPDDSYVGMNGTSMACPHVAGIAALLKAYAPEVPWDMLKTAIMDSARPDPRLAGMMQAEGHANAYRALRMLRALWMAFDPEAPVVPASGSTAVNVTFNAGGVLLPGHYEADIVLESGTIDTNRIPVELDVTYAPVPQYVSVRIDDSAGDGDGYAEPGETVDLHVTLGNRGALTLAATTATLATTQAMVTVDSGPLAWTALESGDRVESVPAATVTFGGGVSSPVTFTFDVDDGVNAPWTGLRFTLPVAARHSITGAVREQVTLAPVANATVVCFGAAPAEVTSGPGGAYTIHGLPDGSYTLRARKATYGRSEWQTVVLGGADVAQNLDLGTADGAAMPGTLNSAMLSGQSNALAVALSNAGASDWRGSVYEIARRDVAVISDGTRLTSLETLLTQLGLDVTGYADNTTEYYTAQEDVLSQYDLVIADMGGADGLGRKVVLAEHDAIDSYVSGGGMFIATGRNLLGSPDNAVLGDLVGTSTLGKQVVMVDEAVVAAAPDAAFGGPYITLSAGQRLAVTSNYYDRATADTNRQAAALLHAGMGDKVIRRSLGSGVMLYWNGNHAGAEWIAPGPLQELFRNIVLDLTAADISWLAPVATTFAVDAAGGTNIAVDITAPNALSEVGVDSAALLLVGNLPDRPDRAVVVTLDVAVAALRAMSTTGVRRWDNAWLEGDGGNAACLLQLVAAGPDGTNNPPDLDGGTTGDDTVLATLDTGELFARIGDGYEMQPDQGLFSRRFAHGLMTNQQVYVRAWDAPTFAGAVAYGDSARYAIQRIADEEHDFGTWIVDSSVDFPGNALAALRDQDDDSIPDGYALQIGLDPRNPIGPLTPSVTVEAEAAGFDDPGRVCTWSNFVFVADSEHNRIVVLSRDLQTRHATLDGYGTGNGEFDSPQGLAVDGAASRLIVADTHNHRVQMLDINPASGALTYAAQFGCEGLADGQFNTPYAVEVSQLSGRIYVADSYPHGEGFNHRIQRFSRAGVHESTFGVQGPAGGQFNRPLGIALDAGGLLYTADQDNSRVQCTTTTGLPLWQWGSYGSGLGEMAGPRGVGMGMLSRLYVADTSNHRIQVLRTDDAPGTITPVGCFGVHGDEDGEFSFPQGVCAMHDSPMVYVADTGNDRVQLLSFVMDNDGDGMEDMWEDSNGLDSTDPDDGADDPDGDGIINIGEYRIGTDPQNGDSNGNGGSDGLEVALGRDPLAAPGLDLLIIRNMAFTSPAVDFNVLSGGVYQVATRTNMLSGSWADIDGPVTGSADGVMSVTVPVPLEPTRFYRIRKTN